jgi:hypothetical protein
MSDVEAHVVAESDAILAALVWDRPALMRSPAPGAAAFAEALGSPPYHRDVEGEDKDAPLATAARAIRLELAGQPELAIEEYQRLATIEGWPSVLGGFLLAWSSIPADPTFLDGVVHATHQLVLDDDYLRSKLLIKLATYALDKGRSDLFPDLINEAAETAPHGSALRRAIRISRSNLLGADLAEEDFELRESDPLVDYPWIDDVALHSAQAEIGSLLKARASSPWSWSIRSGRTPLDEVLAANRQATWAGALWLRDPIRQQLGAQMLMASGADAYRTLFGLAMWVTAGGGDIGAIVDFAEPRFDDTTADVLVQQVTTQAVVPRTRDVVVPKLAVSLWDLLSADTIDQLLAELRPTPTLLAIDQDVRHFWGRTALVAPEVWRRHVTELDPPQKAVLLETLPSSVVASLDEDVADSFLSAAAEAPEVVSPAGRAALIVIRHTRGETTTVREDPHPERVAAEVALRRPASLPNDEYEWVEDSLREQRRREAESARSGQVGIGGRSTAADLALAAQARGSVSERSVEELVAEAVDEQLPGDFRLNSLMALARLASVGLATPRVPEIREPADPHPLSFFMPMSADVLRAARLALHASHLDPREQIDLLTLSRHSDARVRQIVVETAGSFLAVSSSPSVEAALLAGLYDPEESVLEAALSSLARAQLNEISSDAVAQRLWRLFHGYGREVRAGVVRAARARPRATEDPRLAEIVDLGRSDRSWLVRDAAGEELE